MRAIMITMATAAMLAACATSPTTGQPTVFGTQLSQCMRNALIGAAVGAGVGAVAGGSGDRVEGAAIGAAVGGGGAFALCKLLDSGEQARIERGYVQALQTNAPYSETWTAANGSARALQVERPQPVAGAAQCRLLNATLIVSNGPSQSLPTERYCLDAMNVWRPSPL